ncbi:MAG: EVE domain-containing protein [Bacteriovoracia bacterium]
MAYWLLKTEPDTYSFSDLVSERKTTWNGIRNFQARNHLRKMKPGDKALIYHTGDEKAVVGIAEVVSEPYLEPSNDSAEWTQVDIKPIEPLQKKVLLSELRQNKDLANLILLKQARLSVMPVEKDDFSRIVKLGKSS